jgi:hypothetical protein
MPERSSAALLVRAKHTLDALYYLFMVQQIATAGSCASFFYCRDEMRVILQQPVHGFLNHVGGLFAGACGELMNLGFLLRCQMYFHA